MMLAALFPVSSCSEQPKAHPHISCVFVCAPGQHPRPYLCRFGDGVGVGELERRARQRTLRQLAPSGNHRQADFDLEGASPYHSGRSDGWGRAGRAVVGQISVLFMTDIETNAVRRSAR
eukprot:scaffold21728_cov39-Prasinocladus_malaysianus.AAC.1